MKKEKELSKADNRRIYRLFLIGAVSGCPRCAPNRGCNSNKWGLDNNWKKYRKTQWK